MMIPDARLLRRACVASALLAGGCALPPVRISRAPVAARLAELPRVVARRPAADLGLRPRDPVNFCYLAGKDTVPDRMSVLRARLASAAYLQKPDATVLVDKFDILHDGSGDMAALPLDLSGKGLGMLDTMKVGNGVNGYRCTQVASVDGRRPVRRVARGPYAHAEDAIGMTPEQHRAANGCVENVIDRWVASARPPPVIEECVPPSRKPARKRGKS